MSRFAVSRSRRPSNSVLNSSTRVEGCLETDWHGLSVAVHGSDDDARAMASPCTVTLVSDLSPQPVEATTGGNLKRHLQRRHKEVYDSILADKASSTKRVVSDEVEGCPAAKLRQVDIQIMFQSTSSKCVLLEITEDSIMNSCVELVPRNGRSFRLIDDSGFRKIIDPVLKALSAKRAITAETVKDKVQEQARSKREEISQTLRKRMFSLKIYCTSRLDRALLGINVHYAEN
ncbi:hypothetical protein HPB50_026094 [Hyalomma asiaticum]|uniref:Uncharacterized protein n=1 Tax=Hyalomma asiaticum TaxID=266040 RepID=A0ACB7TNI2_HYAAI|nr:hypothetical protein HPB50_026094 [Hyalomma asiaticum]